MKQSDTYNRARHSILSYILNFSTMQYYESMPYQHVDAEKGFHGGYCADNPPKLGSLCVLQSAPDTKWYMSWLIQTREGGLGTEYLLKSIEDGSLCWWSNVSIKWYPKAEEFPSWKWTDKQYEFKDRWFRATKRNNDYWTKPVFPEFHEDGSVTLGTRQHVFITLGEGGYSPRKKFPNWKKVKFSEMIEFYQYAVSSKPNREKQKAP